MLLAGFSEVSCRQNTDWLIYKTRFSHWTLYITIVITVMCSPIFQLFCHIKILCLRIVTKYSYISYSTCWLVEKRVRVSEQCNRAPAEFLATFLKILVDSCHEKKLWVITSCLVTIFSCWPITIEYSDFLVADWSTNCAIVKHNVKHIFMIKMSFRRKTCFL